MNEQAYTRCPGCATVFRVSAAQLALREGQVRCGHCRAVFDANDHRVSLGAPANDDPEPLDELAAGRPTVTLRNAEALQPVEPSPPPAAAPVARVADDVETPPDAGTSAQAQADARVEETEAPTATEVGLRAERFEWKPRKPLRERPRALYGVALVLLVALLGAQSLFEYRDALAAHAPLTRPLLATACAIAGCEIGPLRDAGALSIDASDLQADPAHRGLLKLTATIRNRAAYAIAWPYVELTLTDASDRVVARRAFAPSEYAGSIARPDRGIPGNGEDLVTLFLDASETSQAGYRLYLFYP